MTYNEQLLANEAARVSALRLAAWLANNRDRFLAENPHIGLILDGDTGQERFYRSDRVGDTGQIMAVANPIDLLDSPEAERQQAIYHGYGAI